jgi:hypothetical protein
MPVRLWLLIVCWVLALFGGLSATASDLELATFGRLLMASGVIGGGLVVLLDRAERW